MPDLTIRFKRHPDHTASLTCTRRDGSVTWQRQRGKLGAVFPPHDLTHYAVEQTLGYQHGFYGLIADGWAIEDFAKPWPRGPIPVEAQEVEVIVGFFDTERRGNFGLTSESFQDHVQRYLAARRSTKGAAVALCAIRPLSDEDLDRVRSLRSEMLDRWWSVLPGESLELDFERAGSAVLNRR
jgi:hypothetical protein